MSISLLASSSPVTSLSSAHLETEVGSGHDENHLIMVAVVWVLNNVSNCRMCGLPRFAPSRGSLVVAPLVALHIGLGVALRVPALHLKLGVGSFSSFRIRACSATWGMAPKRKRQQAATWLSFAREAQQYRDASISSMLPKMPETARSPRQNATLVPATVLSQEEMRLTELSSEALLYEIASRKITVHVVTLAFLRRAAIAQKLVEDLVGPLSSSAGPGMEQTY